MTKANQDLADIDNQMSSRAQLAELDQEVVKLQRSNVAFQAEVDSLKYQLAESNTMQKEYSIRKM